MPKKSPWISVEDKLPKERVDVLVTGVYTKKESNNSPTCRIGYVRIWSNGPFFVTPIFEGEPPFSLDVTHWMPFPKLEVKGEIK